MDLLLRKFAPAALWRMDGRGGSLKAGSPVRRLEMVQRLENSCAMPLERSGRRPKSGAFWWVGCRCVRARKEPGMDPGYWLGLGWGAVLVTGQRS